MEHIIVTELADGFLRLVPEAGYILYNDTYKRAYSEAIAKSTEGFRAVLSGISPEPHERTLEEAKAEKLAALKAYDASPAVNSFTIGSASLWLTPEERANYLLTMQAASEQGITSVPFMGLTIPTDQAIQMLKAVNIYAMQCVAVTNAHAEAIKSKRAISTVDAYNFMVGYPEHLNFSL